MSRPDENEDAPSLEHYHGHFAPPERSPIPERQQSESQQLPPKKE